MRKAKDLTGKRFGRLTVIKRVNETRKLKGQISADHYWLCRCDCGKEKIANGRYLKRGSTISCGCAKGTHRLTDTRLYIIWGGIKSRCYNPNNRKYSSYGARGINMSDVWKNNFSTFYEWAINNGYKDDLSLDRIDVDKGYYPDNCRWANSKIQANNRQLDKQYTYNGKTMSIKEWCEEIGFYWTIFHK